MNYLAHIYLSGCDKDIQFGNFIADAVKGRSFEKYPNAIAEGIILHRAIDSFTDNHPAVKKEVLNLKPYFGRYSAAVLDIFFDYLLASHFSQFSTITLRTFSWRFYWTMIVKRRWLPTRIKRFMWHFIGTNRLSKYSSLEGIGRSLAIMVRVGRMDISVLQAIEYLGQHEEELWEVFLPFFSELQYFCDQKLAGHTESLTGKTQRRKS